MKDKIRWGILGAGAIAHKFAHDFIAVKKGELVYLPTISLIRASLLDSIMRLRQLMPTFWRTTKSRQSCPMTLA